MWQRDMRVSINMHAIREPWHFGRHWRRRFCFKQVCSILGETTSNGKICSGMDRLPICNTRFWDIQGQESLTRDHLTAFHFFPLKPSWLARWESDLHHNACSHTSRLRCSFCNSSARSALPTYLPLLFTTERLSSEILVTWWLNYT
jgi:hypothetical protein